MGWFSKGASDASQNKGQKNPNDFQHHQEREKYQAGWNSAKNKK
jgi:hypothetical protein